MVKLIYYGFPGVTCLFLPCYDTYFEMRKRILIYALFSLALPSVVSGQWDSCPFGEVNDSYPGDCARYIDSDGDGICDLSQPAPEDRVGAGSSDEVLPLEAKPVKSVTPLEKYHAVEWSILSVFLFALTEYLVGSKKLSKIRAKLFWNTVLALSFVLTAATIIPYMFRVGVGFDYIRLHVEAGLLMSWASLYHLWGRLYFYKNAKKILKG